MQTLTTWKIAGHTLRAGLVTTITERRACQRLRYQEYHDVQGSIPDHHDRVDIDWADQHATLLCSTLDDDPRPIGTMRLIHCEEGCLLTHGDDGTPVRFGDQSYALPRTCPLTGAPVRAHETVEGSRYVARLVDFSSLRVVHSNMLLEAALHWCRARGRRQIIGAMREHQWRNLRMEPLPLFESCARDDGQPHRYHDMDYRAVFIPVTPDELQLRRTLPGLEPVVPMVA
jgi:N-acyl-L-homoserine lactone synthetase